MSNKHDAYASEQETLKLLKNDARSDSEKILEHMLEQRWANEQGVDIEAKYKILREITLELLDQRA